MVDSREIQVRRTDPWMWVAIVAVTAFLVLLVVWLVAARSPEEAQTKTPITTIEENHKDKLVVLTVGSAACYTILDTGEAATGKRLKGQ